MTRKRKRSRNGMRYAGKWDEPVSHAIQLPFTRPNLLRVLEWGTLAEGAPFSHYDIAHWCDRFWTHFREADPPEEIAKLLPVAEDVEMQWEMFLPNTYTLEELQKLDFGEVRLPVEWFERWLERAGA